MSHTYEEIIQKTHEVLNSMKEGEEISKRMLRDMFNITDSQGKESKRISDILHYKVRIGALQRIKRDGNYAVYRINEKYRQQVGSQSKIVSASALTKRWREVWDSLEYGDRFTARDFMELAGASEKRKERMSIHAFLRAQVIRGLAQYAEPPRSRVHLYEKIKYAPSKPQPKTKTAPAPKTQELDLIDIGASILAVIKDKDREIESLKKTIKNMNSEIQLKDLEILSMTDSHRRSQEKIRAMSEKLGVPANGFTLNEL